MLELACKNWLLALGEFCELTLKFKKCKIIIKHVFLKANIIDTQNSSLPHCFVTFYYYPWHPLFSHPLKVTGPSFSSLLFREFTFEHLKICLKSISHLLEEGAEKWQQRHHPWFQWSRDPPSLPSSLQGDDFVGRHSTTWVRKCTARRTSW